MFVTAEFGNVYNTTNLTNMITPDTLSVISMKAELMGGQTIATNKTFSEVTTAVTQEPDDVNRTQSNICTMSSRCNCNACIEKSLL